MDDKKAADILTKLLAKRLLNAEEKVAIETAIGILGWTTLAKGRLKALGKARKTKLDKSTEW